MGAILFFALTGQGPFDRESLPRLLVSIWSDPAPRLASLRPHVPEALEILVARALEKAPQRRFASASELRAALATITCSDPLPTELPWASASGVREASTLQPSIPGLRRTRRVVMMALALCALLACVLAVGRWWPAAPRSRPVATVRTAAPRPAAPQLELERLEQPAREPEPSSAPKPAAPNPSRHKSRRSAPLPEVSREQPAAIENAAPAPVQSEPDPPAQANNPAPVELQLVPAPQELKRVF